MKVNSHVARTKKISSMALWSDDLSTNLHKNVDTIKNAANELLCHALYRVDHLNAQKEKAIFDPISFLKDLAEGQGKGHGNLLDMGNALLSNWGQSATDQKQEARTHFDKAASDCLDD